MPYIRQEDRRKFEDAINNLQLPADAGELNYLLTYICDAYLQQKGKRYTNLNEVIGVLECAKQEFYRRVAAPYEDGKISENGDVYNGGQP
jgi:hypothetical protein